MTHICVSKLTTIGSDDGQAIIWTNDGILLIGSLGANFSEILIEIYIFSLKKMHLKMLSGILRPFCLGLNVFKRLRQLLCNHPYWRTIFYIHTIPAFILILSSQQIVLNHIFGTVTVAGFDFKINTSTLQLQIRWFSKAAWFLMQRLSLYRL